MGFIDMSDDKSFEESLRDMTVTHIKKLSRESQIESGIKRKAGPMKNKKKKKRNMV